MRVSKNDAHQVLFGNLLVLHAPLGPNVLRDLASVSLSDKDALFSFRSFFGRLCTKGTLPRTKRALEFWAKHEVTGNVPI